MKFETQDGQEFEAPCFANLWRYISSKIKKGGVYMIIFNRRQDEPNNLIVGKPGWAFSAHSAGQCVINVDEIQL